MMRRLSIAAIGVFGVAGLAGASGAPPEPASTRAAFEAMYPATTTSAAALELERLASTLGIDLARSEEKGQEKHDHPTAEAAQAYAAVMPVVFGFLDRELKNVDERVGVPPPALAAYLDEHDAALDSIRAAASGDREIVWDVDVARRREAPLPNLLGQIRLQRLLVARALVQTQRGDGDAALQTLEASWRLTDALFARPEMISLLIGLAGERFQAGALRKIDAPAYGWADRLRSPRSMSAFAAAVANQVWFLDSEITDLTGREGGAGRMWRRIAEEVLRLDVCLWDAESLHHIAEEAATAEFSEDEGVSADAMPNLLSSFERLRRVLIDQELTALVLDARAERAASRRRAWPGRLLTLGAGVCPREPWSYRASKNGTVTIAFGGRSDETEAVGLRLPFTVNAGVPVAPARRGPPRRPFARKAAGAL